MKIILFSLVALLIALLIFSIRISDDRFKANIHSNGNTGSGSIVMDKIGDFRITYQFKQTNGEWFGKVNGRDFRGSWEPVTLIYNGTLNVPEFGISI